jgi:uncharacterized protein
MTDVAQLTPDPGFLAGWLRWRQKRLAALNADDGHPTLVATHWLDEGNRVPGIPGTWRIENDNVILRLDDGGEARIGDALQRGSVIAHQTGDEIGPMIRFESRTVRVTTRLGRRGVRVFDHARAGTVKAVDGFEPSTEWVVEGTFIPHAEDRAQRYRFELEREPREVTTPGSVTFALGGRQYETRPFLDEGWLLLVFADRTTGETTKPPSRFLLIVPPERLDRPAPVTIDFNRAFLPPCAFSNEFNCPLPPPAHRFDIAVTAGEQWARLQPRELG